MGKWGNGRMGEWGNGEMGEWGNGPLDRLEDRGKVDNEIVK
jgi:hypothetical protein